MIHTVLQTFFQLRTLEFLLLQCLAPFALNPGLGRIIRMLFFERRLFFLRTGEICSDARDCAFLAIFRSTRCRGKVAKGRTRLEECQQGRGELVRHDGLLESSSSKGKDVGQQYIRALLKKWDPKDVAIATRSLHGIGTSAVCRRQ
jgi:hypothetical protein